MQASVWLHCSFVTLNSYIKSPQKFVLCYLSVACSQFLACFTVQFSRCRSSDLSQDQIETLRIYKMLQSKLGGDKRDRTADLLNAIQALSQLSYTPISNYKLLVGPSGLEPPTSRLSVMRSSQLSYGPVSTHRRAPSKLNNVITFPKTLLTYRTLPINLGLLEVSLERR